MSSSSSLRLLMGGEGILDLDLRLAFASSVLSHDICSSGMTNLDFCIVSVSSTCGGGGKLLKLGKDVGGGGGKSSTAVGNGGANVGGGA